LNAPAAPAPHPERARAALATAAKKAPGEVIGREAKDEALGTVLAGKRGDRQARQAPRRRSAAEEKRKADVNDRFALATQDADVKLSINAAGEGTLFDAAAVQLQRGFAAAQAYYRKLGATKEWAENNYYNLPIETQNAELVTINAFWRDFSAWIAAGAKAPFLSAHVAEAHRNFTEMMLALAVLDLPFDAPKHTTKTEGATFTLTAAGPVIPSTRRSSPRRRRKRRPSSSSRKNF
jgi:hypothetical protein